MTRPRKKSRRKRDSNPGPPALQADALTTRPTRRLNNNEQQQQQQQQQKDKQKRQAFTEAATLSGYSTPVKCLAVIWGMVCLLVIAGKEDYEWAPSYNISAYHRDRHRLSNCIPPLSLSLSLSPSRPPSFHPLSLPPPPPLLPSRPLSLSFLSLYPPLSSFSASTPPPPPPLLSLSLSVFVPFGLISLSHCVCFCFSVCASVCVCHAHMLAHTHRHSSWVHTQAGRFTGGSPQCHGAAMPRGRFSNSPVTQLLETSYSLKNSILETSYSLKNKRGFNFSPQRPTTEGIFYGFRIERAMLFRYWSRNTETQSRSSDVAYRICGIAAPWHYGPVALRPVPGLQTTTIYFTKNGSN